MTHRLQRLQRLLLLTVAITALLVSGCTRGPYWTWQPPQGLDGGAQQQAQNECQLMAERELDRFDYFRPYDFYYRDNYRNPRNRHFRPYYALPSYDYLRYDFDLNQLYRFCLQAKGWQRVLIDPLPKQ